jgi:hypothetical protein
VSILLVVVAIASFYVYQRVWVRNLVTEIGELELQNERAGERLETIKSDWMAASSISNIEAAVRDYRLGLEPTRPSQNFTLRPYQNGDQGRYAGLIRAIEKLQKNIPLVSPNEVDAGELFDEK